MKREEIIVSVQKCAREIGGRTPSEKVFYKMSGVGVWDRMKYWPNYGELVLEAGLQPNKFDKTKYSHSQLCELFIGVIRDKKQWPTRGILDVKRHYDPSFPTSATFYKKLGLTRDLAHTILEFVGDKDGFEDIVGICKAVLKQFEKEDRSLGEEIVTSGFVYLGKQHGKYKIGKAKDANRRREDITLLGSEPFKLIHEIETDDMSGVEKYWHDRFESKWIRGEWFNLNQSDVKAFKRWKHIF